LLAGRRQFLPSFSRETIKFVNNRFQGLRRRNLRIEKYVASVDAVLRLVTDRLVGCDERRRLWGDAD
jgi:hypothetical protein